MARSPVDPVISLGCRLNIAESARIRAMLDQAQSQAAGDQRPPTLVINSCAVTSEAVRQTRQAIRKARRQHPDARLMVTGCAADIERDQISAMPEVDGIIANASKLDPRVWNVGEATSIAPPVHTRAFIAVQNGCDHACTFCVIPQGRGVSRSLTIAQVLDDIARHLEQGAPEIVLTGVDMTSWGADLPDQPKLGHLVEAILAQFPDLARLRMSSLDGIEIDPLLESLFASEPRLMPHLHLSLQHGHDMILKRMKRRHLRKDAIALVERLRTARPDIAIGADLIAGFPTESEEMHQANLSIIAELGVVHGHIFPYSPRPGTPAARMPQLDRALIKHRAKQLREAVGDVRNQWLDGLIGTRQWVLSEGDGTGHAQNFARIAVPHGTPSGQIIGITPKANQEGLLI